mmetsp:Transcript_72444/g.109304  ORF Transcript_72444/g.109304 Transcript_72444/m.109304 type:complete len:240 (-) Transcript_72444:545-1264(-)
MRFVPDQELLLRSVLTAGNNRDRVRLSVDCVQGLLLRLLQGLAAIEIDNMVHPWTVWSNEFARILHRSFAVLELRNNAVVRRNAFQKRGDVSYGTGAESLTQKVEQAQDLYHAKKPPTASIDGKPSSGKSSFQALMEGNFLPVEVDLAEMSIDRNDRPELTVRILVAGDSEDLKADPGPLVADLHLSQLFEIFVRNLGRQRSGLKCLRKLERLGACSVSAGLLRISSRHHDAIYDRILR